MAALAKLMCQSGHLAGQACFGEIIIRMCSKGRHQSAPFFDGMNTRALDACMGTIKVGPSRVKGYKLLVTLQIFLVEQGINSHPSVSINQAAANPCILETVEFRVVIATFINYGLSGTSFTRSIPDWRSYCHSACYSVLVSQAGCNGRVTSRPPSSKQMQIKC